MRLGGTIAGSFAGPSQWEALLIRSGFRAVTAPFDCHTPKAEVDAYLDICRRNDVVIAEIGVWKNLFDPDPGTAAAALDYAESQLALADETGVACCVNIAGTSSADGWDAADRSNFTNETYWRVVESVRRIIDDVRPSRAFYCLEPMPWMVPDSPDVYLQLIKDVDRPRFAAHMDLVNMICTPRRYLAPEAFARECFEKLGPCIKSTHLKDSRMHPTHLTALIEECAPGEGTLDFAALLAIMDAHLPKDGPVLLEHMDTFEAYQRAYTCVRRAAQRAGVVL